MSAFTVQIIIFSFAGASVLAAIFLVVTGGKGKPEFISAFTFGFLLTILAAVDPYQIVELTYGELHIKRKEDSKEYTDKSISLAVKSREANILQEEERLIKKAEFLPEENRSPVDYLNLATEAWRDKKYDDTLKYAFTGLGLNLADARVRATLLHRIGSAYADLKIPDLAINYYKKALDVYPGFSWPHNNLGMLYKEQEKYAEAESEYKKAINLNPKLVMPHYNLANLYFEQKKYTEAESKYKEAIPLAPKDVKSHINLGSLYFEQKKYTEAESEWEKAIALDAENEAARKNLEMVQSLTETDSK